MAHRHIISLAACMIRMGENYESNIGRLYLNPSTDALAFCKGPEDIPAGYIDAVIAYKTPYPKRKLPSKSILSG